VLDEKNKARKKEIRVGFDDGTQIEVVTGLVDDRERVVTAGKSSLKNDTQVKIVEPVTS
jgi:multidrug efflux pump subunit AcrA (membrane-fusion protein)